MSSESARGLSEHRAGRLFVLPIQNHTVFLWVRIFVQVFAHPLVAVLRLLPAVLRQLRPLALATAAVFRSMHLGSVAARSRCAGFLQHGTGTVLCVRRCGICFVEWQLALLNYLQRMLANQKDKSVLRRSILFLRVASSSEGICMSVPLSVIIPCVHCSRVALCTGRQRRTTWPCPC